MVASCTPLTGWQSFFNIHFSGASLISGAWMRHQHWQRSSAASAFLFEEGCGEGLSPHDKAGLVLEASALLPIELGVTQDYLESQESDPSHPGGRVAGEAMCAMNWHPACSACQVLSTGRTQASHLEVGTRGHRTCPDCPLHSLATGHTSSAYTPHPGRRALWAHRALQVQREGNVWGCLPHCLGRRVTALPSSLWRHLHCPHPPAPRLLLSVVSRAR